MSETTPKTQSNPQTTPKLETQEVKLSAIISQFMATLPNAAEWQILAIDVLADVIVFKHEVKETQSEAEGAIA